MAVSLDPDFPCALIIDVPFPTSRLASTALQALQVDKELSSLVSRSFSLTPSTSAPEGHTEMSILRAHYKATTNRMLRVAVNSFMESLSLVIEVMEELDDHSLRFSWEDKIPEPTSYVDTPHLCSVKRGSPSWPIYIIKKPTTTWRMPPMTAASCQHGCQISVIYVAKRIKSTLWCSRASANCLTRPDQRDTQRNSKLWS
ncbi:transcription factor Pcc1-domain-containing protein [Xylariaceae sp. FL0594]|nr:transcription factor Pcc1-domain-containing protein [Xylariaceae sp. FL0594]